MYLQKLSFFSICLNSFEKVRVQAVDTVADFLLRKPATVKSKYILNILEKCRERTVGYAMLICLIFFFCVRLMCWWTTRECINKASCWTRTLVWWGKLWKWISWAMSPSPNWQQNTWDKLTLRDSYPSTPVSPLWVSEHNNRILLLFRQLPTHWYKCCTM